MTHLFLSVYEFFRSHRRMCVWLMIALAGLFAAMTATLDYQEDICDFLPFDAQHKQEMEVYQKISQTDRVVVIFEMRDTATIDPDRLAEAIERFGEIAETADTAHRFRDLTTSIDYDQIWETTDFIYRHIPLFLTTSDYDRIDTLLTRDYVAAQAANDRTMLMLPTGSLLSDNIQRDPLNLFTPTVARLQNAGPAMQFDMADGHIFTSDQRRALAFLTTPYGASETAHNLLLTRQLDDIMAQVETEMSDVKVHSVGAPVIAVGNAQQIKQDSILAVAIAITLILLLLLYSFRSVGNLLLIMLSIAMGWLFAMACLSVIHDSVSIIVLGIASVIIGIAVNYPLHLVAHTRHEPDMRQALKEIITPLLIGNITTVGAFLCLVPMESAAMRDLGLFGSFMLIGTILFVIIFLPHIVRTQSRQTPTSDAHAPAAPRAHTDLLTRLADTSLESRWIVWPVVILTFIFGWFSLDTSFDADISHINYMTDDQRADMQEMQGRMAESDAVPVYVVSEAPTWGEAMSLSEQAQATLDSIVSASAAIEKRSATAFLPSPAEQAKRLARWQRMKEEKHELLSTVLYDALDLQGFDPTSFTEYEDIMTGEYAPIGWEELGTLASRLFPTNVSSDTTCTTVVDVLMATPDTKDALIATLNERLPSNHAFDLQGMNSSLANTLSDEFNYIAFACGFIVFAFLWLSFGSIELAIISFIPMAVSWLWILGLMSIFGMQFNIVNVILATFIFGQGDDYTIFMTEGASYEYAYRRRMLSSYKQSIIISALIMFIGIGSLIVARHPALLSLAQVTIVGMSSVVLMAYLFPPLIFRWMTMHDGRYRPRPLSLHTLLDRLRRAPAKGSDAYYRRELADRFRYKGAETTAAISRAVRRGVIDEARGYSIEPETHIHDCGLGALPILVAMMHPDITVYAHEQDDDLRTIGRYSSQDIPNLVWA